MKSLYSNTMSIIILTVHSCRHLLEYQWCHDCTCCTLTSSLVLDTIQALAFLCLSAGYTSQLGGGWSASNDGDGLWLIAAADLMEAFVAEVVMGCMVHSCRGVLRRDSRCGSWFIIGTDFEEQLWDDNKNNGGWWRPCSLRCNWIHCVMFPFLLTIAS